MHTSATAESLLSLLPVRPMTAAPRTLAAWLGAERCLIYTDVDGVYDKDPRKHADAVRYEHIGYDDMLRLARSGAQVLHDRCVELAKKHGVPITVLSSFREGGGTVVEEV